MIYHLSDHFINQIDNETVFIAGITGGAGSSGRCRTNSWRWTEGENNRNQIFSFNELACANSLRVCLARLWKSWRENFKMETSCYRGPVYRLSNSNFSSTDEELWHGMEFVTEDGNKEAEGNDFLSQGLCQGHHRILLFEVFPALVYAPSSIRCSGAAQGSVPEFTAPGHTNPSSMKPICSHAWGHSPTSPLCAEHPPASPQQSFKERAGCFPVRAATCKNSSTGSSETLTIQNPIPNRAYNFIETYHLLSQISYLLTDVCLSPVSSVYTALLHMVRSTLLWQSFLSLQSWGLATLLPVFAQSAC